MKRSASSCGCSPRPRPSPILATGSNSMMPSCISGPISVYTGVAGPVNLKKQWEVAEETAAKHGKAVRREEWRLVVPLYLAESREEALREARLGAGRFQREYFGDTLGNE